MAIASAKPICAFIEILPKELTKRKLAVGKGGTATLRWEALSTLLRRIILRPPVLRHRERQDHRDDEGYEERNHDDRAGRQVEQRGCDETCHITDKSHRIADAESEVLLEALGGQRRHDQAREDEIDADELHRLRHHQREQDV